MPKFIKEDTYINTNLPTLFLIKFYNYIHNMLYNIYIYIKIHTYICVKQFMNILWLQHTYALLILPNT